MLIQIVSSFKKSNDLFIISHKRCVFLFVRRTVGGIVGALLNNSKQSSLQ